jgi:hypothetical protein
MSLYVYPSFYLVCFVKSASHLRRRKMRRVHYLHHGAVFDRFPSRLSFRGKDYLNLILGKSIAVIENI